MKRLLLLAAAAGALTASAQGLHKLDTPASQLVSLAQGELLSRSAAFKALPAPKAADEAVTVIVTITDESAIEQLEKLGATITSVRDELVLADMTPSQMADATAIDAVKAISLGYENRALLETARRDSHVDEVHAGTGLDKAYDGSGVIVGMMDTGLDPNHVNFRNEDGSNRISRMWIITGSNGAKRELTGDQITSYTTDNRNQTHGTHVMGILAGGYKDKADQVAIFNARGRNTVKRDYPVPYYGVATGAEITPAVGTLDGNNILNAAEYLLEYAKSQNKPAVMNLSLGHNTGPHDGTSASNQYLAKVGKEMLITISAGNEGNTPLSIHKDFKAGDTELKTTFANRTAIAGIVDIWADDATPFDFTIIGVDKTSGNIKYSFDFDGTKSGTTYLTGTGYTAPGYITSVEFNNAFGSRGGIITNINVNPNNNRFNVYINVQTAAGNDANVVPGIIVKGKEGKSIDMYTSGYTYFLDNGLAGYTNGDDKGSINDMACGDNVLSVGAHVNAETWPALEPGGYILDYGSTKGAIANFSSYGTLIDGRQLPHISGPGEAIISSYSKFYIDGGYDGYSGKLVSAKKIEDNRNSYWMEMSGTSMSSPFVAGVLALWLQADPTLTIDEVKNILKATATKDEFTAAAPHRFGYGKIDALAGMKAVLGLGGVSDVKADSKVMVNEVSAGVYEVFIPGADCVNAALYSLSGAMAASVTASGDSATLNADSLAPGIYVLHVNGGGTTDTRKVVVR